MMKSFLASRMRSLRKARNLTQGDVASQLHIERQTYCNYENSTRTPPLEMVISLAEFYHVTVDYLVREDEFFSFPALPEPERSPSIHSL